MTTSDVRENLIHANGIDIHYLEQGAGPPLVLLHGGAVSTSSIWKGHAFAYASHMDRLAEHFRVIAPDARGCGRTKHGGGPITFAQMADDVLGLIDGLGLSRPAVVGFSEGGITATIAAIRKPEAVGALVNDAGYDMFNPQSPSFAMMRQVFGGNPQATRTDLEAVARFFGASPEMRRTFELLQADQDAAQGPGYWKTFLTLAFERTTRSPGYVFDDLSRITAPTLILTGDRDQFCTVEEALVAFRTLQRGALAIVPGVGHAIVPAKIQVMSEFLRRGLPTAS